ncbi:MAG: hypothetical protein GY761_20865 [Hyphomicrobiales bacterium]|nr:hypothetical protein [Hyphomicrobiales bacterium]
MDPMTQKKYTPTCTAAANRGVATPANWNVGDDVVISMTVNDADAKIKFGEFETMSPYLRMTKLEG